MHPLILMKELSEKREGGLGLYVLGVERTVIHAEHEYALDEADYFPKAACHHSQHYCYDSGTDFAKIEVLHADAAEQYGQQSRHPTAFCLRTCGKRIVGIPLGRRLEGLLLLPAVILRLSAVLLLLVSERCTAAAALRLSCIVPCSAVRTLLLRSRLHISKIS